MVKSFDLILPSKTYQNETNDSKTFNNLYGKWTVKVTSESYGVISGEVTLIPAIDADVIDFKQTKIAVIIQSSYNYDTKNAMHSGNLKFTFGPTKLLWNEGYSSSNLEITVKVDVPQPAFKTTNSQKGAAAHLKKLFETANDADVTIKSNEKEVKVHKLILSRSQVFAKMINGTSKEARTGEIEITDITYDVLVEMCRYLYYDSIPKMEILALELLIAADKYMIEDLAADCALYLMFNITDENFLDIVVTADQLNKEALREAAIDFIIENRKEIFSSEDWKTLKKNNVQLAMLVLEKISLINV